MNEGAPFVGKRGPEIFVPNKAGRIVPNVAFSEETAAGAREAYVGALRAVARSLADEVASYRKHSLQLGPLSFVVMWRWRRGRRTT